MSYIQSIGTAVPQYKYSQESISDFMQAQIEGDTSTQRKINILHKKSGIEFRYSVLPDFSKQNTSVFESNKNVLVEDRLDIFKTEAVKLGIQSINAMSPSIDLDKISHIITVSCTGMMAPGLEICIAEELGLASDVEKFAVNFMGCYAAFHALKMADYICRAEPTAQVLIVCVELCTLHFNQAEDEDQLRANTLFSDGAASILINSESTNNSWKIKTFYNNLLNKGKDDMAWSIHSDGFKMKLSSYIPNLVKDGIKPLVDTCLNKLAISSEQIDFWAIHPGGLKILTTSEQALDLNSNALDASKKVLRQFGNMSSPTILFVLNEFWQNNTKKGNILAAGFGPGLTLESCLIEIE